MCQFCVILIKQGAAADAEAKSMELSQAVEELHKLLKEAGDGEKLTFTLCSNIIHGTSSILEWFDFYIFGQPINLWKKKWHQ